MNYVSLTGNSTLAWWYLINEAELGKLHETFEQNRVCSFFCREVNFTLLSAAGAFIIDNLHNLVFLSRHTCSLIMLVTGSHACIVEVVNVQCRQASYKLPMVMRKSGNPGLMQAIFVSSGLLASN